MVIQSRQGLRWTRRQRQTEMENSPRYHTGLTDQPSALSADSYPVTWVAYLGGEILVVAIQAAAAPGTQREGH